MQSKSRFLEKIPQLWGCGHKDRGRRSLHVGESIIIPIQSRLFEQHRSLLRTRMLLMMMR